MAKFCKYCGAPLEEGQVCTCQESQAAAQAASAPAAAPAAVPAQSAAAQQAKALLTQIKDILLCYIKTPRDAVQTTMNSSNHLALAGIFAGVNAIAAMLFVWGLFARVIGSVTGVVGDALEIKYPFFAILVTGIALAVVFIGMSGVALFACGKITKRDIHIKYALVIAAAGSIFPSALLLVGTVLGFLSWKLQLLCLAVAAMVWVANGLSDLSDYTGQKVSASTKDLAIVVAAMLVVALVCFFVAGKLLGWCVGEISVMGQKIGDIDLSDLISLF